MGIDKSLTDDFPSVIINGRKYRYGRENEYGQYLVEDADPLSGEYWRFDRHDDLIAFLVNLPESADWEAFKSSHPDWYEVTREQRVACRDARDPKLRLFMEENQKAGAAANFHVLCFDPAGNYCAYADPDNTFNCDDVEVEVVAPEVSSDDWKEFLIELKTRPRCCEDTIGPIRIWRKQALSLASALIQAAEYAEEQLPREEQ